MSETDAIVAIGTYVILYQQIVTRPDVNVDEIVVENIVQYLTKVDIIQINPICWGTDSCDIAILNCEISISVADADTVNSRTTKVDIKTVYDIRILSRSITRPPLCESCIIEVNVPIYCYWAMRGTSILVYLFISPYIRKSRMIEPSKSAVEDTQQRNRNITNSTKSHRTPSLSRMNNQSSDVTNAIEVAHVCPEWEIKALVFLSNSLAAHPELKLCLLINQ